MDKVRADRWLWAARFFKQRKLATEACQGGHVHSGGNTVKPGSFFRIGQEVEVRNEWGLRQVKVVGLSDKRLSAPLAQQLYEVLKAEPKPRDPMSQAGVIHYPSQRPTKRDRRKLEQLLGLPPEEV